MTKEDKAVLDRIYDKHYGSNAKKQTKEASGETRNALMLKAKEKGIKNFRILNKDELAFVLCEKQSQENIDACVKQAVERWKAGWGKKVVKI